MVVDVKKAAFGLMAAGVVAAVAGCSSTSAVSSSTDSQSAAPSRAAGESESVPFVIQAALQNSTQSQLSGWQQVTSPSNALMQGPRNITLNGSKEADDYNMAVPAGGKVAFESLVSQDVGPVVYTSTWSIADGGTVTLQWETKSGPDSGSAGNSGYSCSVGGTKAYKCKATGDPGVAFGALVTLTPA